MPCDPSIQPGLDTGIVLGQPPQPRPMPGYGEAGAMVLRIALFGACGILIHRGYLSASARHWVAGVPDSALAGAIAVGTTWASWLAKKRLADRVAKHIAQQAADATQQPVTVSSSDPPETIAAVPAPNDPHPLADFVNSWTWTGPLPKITWEFAIEQPAEPKRKAAKKRKRK